MGSQSKIEWTDASWNPVRARLKSGGAGADDARALPAGDRLAGWHCEHVSEGCRNCYAESINERLGTKLAFKPGNLHAVDIFLDEKLLTDPLRWKKPRSVFLSSMTDVFADFVTDEMLDRMFAVMALSPQHFFRVLTKRPERMRAYLSAARAHPVALAALDLTMQSMVANPQSKVGEGCILQGDIAHLKVWPLPNVGLGVSVEDQATADERIPHLLATPAAMRFVSAEPLLGAVSLTDMCNGHYFYNALTGARWHDAEGGAHDMNGGKIDEVIVGGESGRQARPMHPGWARSLRDQCAEAGVSFFFKQWGEWAPLDPATALNKWFDAAEMTGDGWRFGAGNPAIPAEARGEYFKPVLFRVGKKAAGAMLDGRAHLDVAPQVGAHFERLCGSAAAPVLGIAEGDTRGREKSEGAARRGAEAQREGR